MKETNEYNDIEEDLTSSNNNFPKIEPGFVIEEVKKPEEPVHKEEPKQPTKIHELGPFEKGISIIVTLVFIVIFLCAIAAAIYIIKVDPLAEEEIDNTFDTTTISSTTKKTSTTTESTEVTSTETTEETTSSSVENSTSVSTTSVSTTNTVETTTTVVESNN